MTTLTIALMFICCSSSELGSVEPTLPIDCVEGEVTHADAKEMVLHFLATQRAANSELWMQTSRKIIEKKKIRTIQTERGCYYKWGPWMISPRKRTVYLGTSVHSLTGVIAKEKGNSLAE